MKMIAKPTGIIQNPRIGRNPKIPPATRAKPAAMRSSNGPRRSLR